MSETVEGDAGTKYCWNCGEEMFEEAVVCPDCGVDQSREVGDSTSVTTPGSGSWTDQYSTLTWLGSLIVALLTFPIGLIIPAYFYIKAKGDEPPNQGTWEVSAVIFFGIFGIAAVEIGGETGAKVLWAISVVVILFLLVALVGLLAGF